MKNTPNSNFPYVQWLPVHQTSSCYISSLDPGSAIFKEACHSWYEFGSSLPCEWILFFVSMRLFSAGNVVEGFNLAKKGILPLLLWQFYGSCRSERVALRLFLNFRSRLLPHPLIQKSLRWMRCLPRSIREFSPATPTRPIYCWTLRANCKGFPRQEVFMSIRRHTLCL